VLLQGALQKDMIKRLDNVKLNIAKPQSELLKIAQKQLGGRPLKYFKILKKSLDARDKNSIFWLYSIVFSDEVESEIQPEMQKINGNPKVAIIGSGPAGLMCAIRLVEHGFKPIIIERGECVQKRKETINNFIANRQLNVNSNVQFGEGGAGAFSDGKLNTQTKDGLNKDVLKIFNKFGAPDEILYLNKPHVGSDILYDVLINMRKFIEDNGGKFMFNSQVSGLIKDNNNLKGLIIKNTQNGEESNLDCDCAVLACGHSARDTFEMLDKSGIYMEAKDFAVGVRIEHLANNIGFAQYGKNYKFLPTADYKLVSHAHERTVFTFCMCPGGVVIPAASEQGGVVVNGMSLHARADVNSNSALMVQMKKSDFGSDDLFAGMRFQRSIEECAFIAGGKNYNAPAQLFGDFAKDKLSSHFGEVKASYPIGTTFAPLNEVLPKVATEALKAAIPDMGKRLKGFDCPDAVLTGVETRFSSPVKIVRDDSLQSVSLKGVYPCGEGSGYSGGITSSAADGLKVAEGIFNRYCYN
jgi:hypothetical protein